MTQEDKDLLLKDLCGRLPYGVIVNIKGFDYDYYAKLTQIYKGVGCSIQVTNNISYDIEQVKPYLFPMSSMTKEQKGEYDDLCEHILDDLGYPASFDTVNSLDYLNKHNIDHRGLIPKGLSIDATGLNIY